MVNIVHSTLPEPGQLIFQDGGQTERPIVR